MLVPLTCCVYRRHNFAWLMLGDLVPHKPCPCRTLRSRVAELEQEVEAAQQAKRTAVADNERLAAQAERQLHQLKEASAKQAETEQQLG
jgi:hypothetical protein